LIPDLIRHGFDAIYIMTNTVRPGMEPFDKDRAYWTVRTIHEAFSKACRHVVWQIGNEVVSGHFDPRASGRAARRASGRGPRRVSGRTTSSVTI